MVYSTSDYWFIDWANGTLPTKNINGEIMPLRTGKEGTLQYKNCLRAVDISFLIEAIIESSLIAGVPISLGDHNCNVSMAVPNLACYYRSVIRYPQRSVFFNDITNSNFLTSYSYGKISLSKSLLNWEKFKDFLNSTVLGLQGTLASDTSNQFHKNLIKNVGSLIRADLPNKNWNNVSNKQLSLTVMENLFNLTQQIRYGGYAFISTTSLSDILKPHKLFDASLQADWATKNGSSGVYMDVKTTFKDTSTTSAYFYQARFSVVNTRTTISNGETYVVPTDYSETIKVNSTPYLPTDYYSHKVQNTFIDYQPLLAMRSKFFKNTIYVYATVTVTYTFVGPESRKVGYNKTNETPYVLQEQLNKTVSKDWVCLNNYFNIITDRTSFLTNDKTNGWMVVGIKSPTEFNNMSKDFLDGLRSEMGFNSIIDVFDTKLLPETYWELAKDVLGEYDKITGEYGSVIPRLIDYSTDLVTNEGVNAESKEYLLKQGGTTIDLSIDLTNIYVEYERTNHTLY